MAGKILMSLAIAGAPKSLLKHINKQYFEYMDMKVFYCKCA